MIASMDLQHTVRCLVRGVPHIFLGGVPAERAGDDRLALHKLGLSPTGRPALYSDAFADGAPIPQVHTADGEGMPPPLGWDAPPPATRSLALLVEDPDAPTPNPFVHWIVTNLPPVAGTIEQALAKGAHEGRNSMFRTGWAPCAPPRGDDTHRYFFQLFALTRELRSGISGRAALLSAIRGRVIGSSILVGTHRR
jgi:Raf kinase inhibitor-like YbhB/YbcL family protein